MTTSNLCEMEQPILIGVAFCLSRGFHLEKIDEIRYNYLLYSSIAPSWALSIIAFKGSFHIVKIRCFIYFFRFTQCDGHEWYFA